MAESSANHHHQNNSYANISASQQARQHNGNIFNNNTYHYPPRQRKSDETLKAEQRNDRFLKAAAQGQLPRLQYLVRLGVDIDRTDDQGYTALHHAVLSGFEDCVQELIILGADVNTFTSFYETPLSLAAHKQRHNVVRILLDARADVLQALNRKDAQEWERRFLLSCMPTSGFGCEGQHQPALLFSHEQQRPAALPDVNKWMHGQGPVPRNRSAPSVPLATPWGDGIARPDSHAQPQSSLPFTRYRVHIGRESNGILDQNQILSNAGAVHTLNSQYWRDGPVESRGRQLDRGFASPWGASSGDAPYTPSNQLPSHLETVSSGNTPETPNNQLLSHLEIMYRPRRRARSVYSDIDSSVNVSPPPTSRRIYETTHESPAPTSQQPKKFASHEDIFAEFMSRDPFETNQAGTLDDIFAERTRKDPFETNQAGSQIVHEPYVHMPGVSRDPEHSTDGFVRQFSK